MGYGINQRFPRCTCLAPLAVLFFIAALIFWPVDTLIVYLEKTRPGSSPPVVFSSVMPLGQSFWTGYIHSVQRTPVLDCYRVAGSRIWSWRELVQSHNAGLPFQAPLFGRFYMDSPWMIIEGGRRDWEEIFLRVGNEELGRNVFAIKQGRRATRMALYADYPGKRLKLEARRAPLALAASCRAEEMRQK